MRALEKVFLDVKIILGKDGAIAMQTQPSTIKSEQRNLGALLSDKRQLKVPAYQRNFSWTVSEITDFWDDLQGIIYEDRENYF